MTEYYRGDDGRLYQKGDIEVTHDEAVEYIEKGIVPAKVRKVFISSSQFHAEIDIQQEMEVIELPKPVGMIVDFSANGVPLKVGMQIDFIDAGPDTSLSRPPNAAFTWGKGRSFAARQRRQRRIAWGFPE